ncbi:hypothetical protein J1N35_024922 [Gossypium stocksii]|uniref:Uncharacterized protein n=1 Tax=Gossypium stocksii TaxID=47602 RepID=A0A9D3V5G0_9ROSI|nr:hypothetical protein J1N35_024922 [Gossypium stocksii]
MTTRGVRSHSMRGRGERSLVALAKSFSQGSMCILEISEIVKTLIFYGGNQETKDDVVFQELIRDLQRVVRAQSVYVGQGPMT